MAAAADGLFAEHGLEVEILDPIPRAGNIGRVASDGAEFCLTSVNHYLAARQEMGEIPARFASVIGQRHTIGALIPTESPLERIPDLAGQRLAGQADSPLVLALQAALALRDLAPAELVDADQPAVTLGRGEADLIAATVDTRRRNERQAGRELRAIPLDLDVYMSGLVAADHLPLELVTRVRAALCAALQHQRQEPAGGVIELLSRYPDVDPEDALEGWKAVEPYIFTAAPPGSMERERWATTLTFVETTYGLPHPAAETVYRPELVDRPVAA